MPSDFADEINVTKNFMRYQSSRIHTEKWQGVDVSKRPEAEMWEILFYTFFTHMPTEDLQYYRDQIKPNLPWADDHFLERVSGEPLNPGVQWKNWPWARSAQKFIDNSGVFSHTYMERYWPRRAGRSLQPQKWQQNYGIRFRYGDLNDLVEFLVNEPLTRQAYFPVWFPEDTGVAHRERKPCSLGYHFLVRDSKLHIVYYIRSCDFIRHFRDDIYLTVRLALWVLDECRKHSERWKDIVPGQFHMHISSLHMFRNDYIQMFGERK